MNELSPVLHLDTKRSKTASILVPALFVVMWSSGAVFVKLGLQFTQPLAFLSLRLSASALVMWACCAAFSSKLPSSIKQIALVAVTALLLQVGYQGFFFMALYYEVSPGMLAIILGTQPIVTALLAWRRVRREQWLGLLLGIVGLTLVVSSGISTSRVQPLGLLCAVLSLLSITFGTVFQKKHCAEISLPASMSIQYTISAVVITVLSLTLEPYTFAWSQQLVVSLSWMVLVVSVGATLLLYLMIQRRNLTNVASAFYCVPPATALIDYLVFGHGLGSLGFAGMAIIVGGLIQINR